MKRKFDENIQQFKGSGLLSLDLSSDLFVGLFFLMLEVQGYSPPVAEAK
jgi:hypothetical protein